MSVQLATRVDDVQAAQFREVAKRLGTTPSDALRMFVAAFNDAEGFPYDVRLQHHAEPFNNEREASEFASDMAIRMLDETR